MSVSRETLLRYLEGDLPTSEAAELETAIQASPELGARLERYRKLTGLVAEPDADVAEVHLDLAAITRAPERKPRRWFGLAAAASVLVAVVLSTALLREEEFTAKSGLADPLELSSIQAFVVEGARFQEVERSIRADDRVAFAYTNLKGSGRSHLMIYGVDEAGSIFWYHPAYESADQNPVSIPITEGVEVLPDAVRHDLAQGPLQIHALFSNEPLSVKAVEARHSEARAPTFEDTTVVTISLEVEP